MTRRALNLARWPCRVHSDVTVRPAGVTGRSGQRIGNGPQVTPPLAGFANRPEHGLERGGPRISENYFWRVSPRSRRCQKLAGTVYSRQIVRRHDSGRDPSLEPLKRPSPTSPMATPAGNVAGPCGPYHSTDIFHSRRLWGPLWEGHVFNSS